MAILEGNEVSQGVEHSKPKYHASNPGFVIGNSQKFSKIQ